jgi:hypothetical protein
VIAAITSNSINTSKPSRHMKIAMKNAICISIVIGLSILSGCSDAQSMLSKKILIVYLSRTNNTKAVAQIIHRHVGGKLIALELQQPYPENYQQTVAQVVRENETGYLPPLKTKIDSIEHMKLYFLAFLPGACRCRRQ